MKKTRKAREDKEGTAKPMTQLVGQVLPGKLNLPGNIMSYELRHVDPNEKM